MRERDEHVALTPQQRQAADAGMKAMMPVNGHPFLAYLLSAIADAGLREVALIVAPEHENIRDFLGATPPVRTRVSLVVQQEALGTADAVLAASDWVAQDPFLVMNADNLYPVQTLRDLAALDEPAFAAFDAHDLASTSNIPTERMRAFAVVTVDAEGYLTSIVEKPRDSPDSVLTRKVSMNIWRFDRRIFAACRDVPRSARGEFELPEAVALAVARGMRVRGVDARGPVLDLSRRADAADVARRLARVTPWP